MDSQHDAKPTANRSPDTLRAFLRSEMIAVQNYQLAGVELGRSAPPEIAECLDSHRMRLLPLTARIDQLGVLPPDDSVLWSGLSRLLRNGTYQLGLHMVIDGLAKTEILGLAEYRWHPAWLDRESLILVNEVLLPEQQRTHDLMLRLSLEGCGRTAARPATSDATRVG